MPQPNSSYTIAVSQRIDVVSSYGEVRDALDQNLIRWLSGCGSLPVPVPNSLIEERPGGSMDNQALLAWLGRLEPDAIVLSGGNNIGEYLQRDETEKTLLRWADEHRLPVLGICRGMQMMGVAAGGSLEPVEGHVRTYHHLNSKNPDAWPERVNSYHDYRLSACPPGYRLLATSEDGTLEAMRHEFLPREGWMWHPEREKEFHERDSGNLQKLLREGRQAEKEK
ncbi:MAG: gamma-glutamyl-gamma-aminobutyrate hydrolase family protein [Balneolaceae bacterium]